MGLYCEKLSTMAKLHLGFASENFFFTPTSFFVFKFQWMSLVFKGECQVVVNFSCRLKIQFLRVLHCHSFKQDGSCYARCCDTSLSHSGCKLEFKGKGERSEMFYNLYFV
jgi:hypothetical protein